MIDLCDGVRKVYITTSRVPDVDYVPTYDKSDDELDNNDQKLDNTDMPDSESKKSAEQKKINQQKD